MLVKLRQNKNNKNPGFQQNLQTRRKCIFISRKTTEHPSSLLINYVEPIVYIVRASLRANALTPTIKRIANEENYMKIISYFQLWKRRVIIDMIF